MKQIIKQLLRAAVLCLVMVGAAAISVRARAEEGGFVINNGILESYSGSGNEVIIPENVKEIGKKAFYKNETIQKVTISGSVEKIGSFAFSDCAVKKLVIPEGVTTMSQWALSGLGKLQSIKLPRSLKKIPKNAFEADTSLKKVVIPNWITE